MLHYAMTFDAPGLSGGLAEMLQTGKASMWHEVMAQPTPHCCLAASVILPDCFALDRMKSAQRQEGARKRS
jgi:hypothetical protein